MQIKPAQMGGEGGKMADFSTQNRQNRVTVVLGVANPLMLAAMSEIFEKDARFSLVATAATAEGSRWIAATTSWIAPNVFTKPDRDGVTNSGPSSPTR